MTEAMVSLFGEIGFVGHSVAPWDWIGFAGRFLHIRASMLKRPGPVMAIVAYRSAEKIAVSSIVPPICGEHRLAAGYHGCCCGYRTCQESDYCGGTGHGSHYCGEKTCILSRCREQRLCKDASDHKADGKQLP